MLTNAGVIDSSNSALQALQSGLGLLESSSVALGLLWHEQPSQVWALTVIARGGDGLYVK